MQSPFRCGQVGEGADGAGLQSRRQSWVIMGEEGHSSGPDCHQPSSVPAGQAATKADAALETAYGRKMTQAGEACRREGMVFIPMPWESGSLVPAFF